MSSARVDLWECLRWRGYLTREQLRKFKIDQRKLEKYIDDWADLHMIYVDDSEISTNIHVDNGIIISKLLDRIDSQEERFGQTLRYLCNERAETYLERHVHKDVLCIIMSYVRE
jgi:hypothetical protein